MFGWTVCVPSIFIVFVRGWIILGKKQTCPYCSEKVNTKALTAHPWEKYNHMYRRRLFLLVDY